MAYVIDFADYSFTSPGCGLPGVVWTVGKYALKVSAKTSGKSVLLNLFLFINLNTVNVYAFVLISLVHKSD